MIIHTLSIALLSGTALLAVGSPATAAPVDAGKVITVSVTSGFITPSGKAVCILDDAEKGTKARVRCDLAHGAKVTTAPKPAYCDVDWAYGMLLGKRPAILCGGDTVLGEAWLGTPKTAWWTKAKTPVVGKSASLPYGMTMRFRNISCTTAKTGTTCVNTDTKRGFTMWAGGHKTF